MAHGGANTLIVKGATAVEPPGKVVARADVIAGEDVQPPETTPPAAYGLGRGRQNRTAVKALPLRSHAYDC
jgi:hypothetical protein